MLKSIVIITFSVLNLGPVETAYHEDLAYATVERGVVSATLGSAWDAPAATGRDYLIMQPASKAEVYLRFIEGPQVEGYAPLKTFGWNATELLVLDPDALAARLTDSAFEIIGPPKDLWSAPNAPMVWPFATSSTPSRVRTTSMGRPSLQILAICGACTAQGCPEWPPTQVVGFLWTKCPWGERGGDRRLVTRTK